MDDENPLEQPAPEDPIERVYALAYDIAYGAAHKMWSSHFRVTEADDEGIIFDYGLREGLREKWGDDPSYYSTHLLVSFGYLVQSSLQLETPDRVFYDLTAKAYALLEKPFKPPAVFISYRQEESSALALLVESRLKLADKRTNIFIDKLIEPSDSLGTQIQNAIENCRFFICLLGPTTLIESVMVRQEIELARAQNDCIIIPICHNHFVFDDTYEKYFGDAKAVVVNNESAEEYEIAMTKLLLKMGYSTI